MTTKTHKGDARPTHTHEGAQEHSPEASLDDQLAVHRGLSPIEASAIPTPPDDFKPTEVLVRNRRLRRVADRSRPQMMLALDEVAARGAGLQADLGQYAPGAEAAAQLSRRASTLSAAVSAASRLLNYLEELDEITLSDAALYLDSVNREYTHALSHKPSLATTYEQLARFINSRGEAISEGLAQAARSAPAEPAKKDG
jgi:hypothetical protein